MADTTCTDADLARALEYARRLTASGIADDGTILSRALLRLKAELAAANESIDSSRETIARFALALESANEKIAIGDRYIAALERDLAAAKPTEVPSIEPWTMGRAGMAIKP